MEIPPLTVPRILDLGCGTGKWPERLLTRPNDAFLIGIDISPRSCIRAMQHDSKPPWVCICARGEHLPLGEKTVDIVLSNVAMPYMNIPAALNEVRRVLKPGGSTTFSLHPFSFWLQDLRKQPPFRPTVLLYRLYVAANGLLFHLTGHLVRYPFARKRVESWQSERGMRIALQRAGLTESRCTRLQDGGFIVQALRPALPKTLSVQESAAA
jgi:ubiquinone/menaquinone biosynthesis C-methylase UbiE